MADIFTKEKRSKIMSKIKSKNTSIEKEVFSYLRKERVYFKMHYKKATGNPDIALPRKKKAVFIDGDFWHGWNFEKTRERLPEKYWRGKIEKNVMRDKRNRSILRKQGWKVIRIWEHQIKKYPARTLKRIKDFLQCRAGSI